MRGIPSATAGIMDLACNYRECTSRHGMVMSAGVLQTDKPPTNQQDRIVPITPECPGSAGPLPDPFAASQLAKAVHFFRALLATSAYHGPAVYETARVFLQALVNGTLNPEDYAPGLPQRLRPPIILILEACIVELREGVSTGVIVIDGIAPSESSSGS